MNTHPRTIWSVYASEIDEGRAACRYNSEEFVLPLLCVAAAVSVGSEIESEYVRGRLQDKM